jgi:hypothetical protein
MLAMSAVLLSASSQDDPIAPEMGSFDAVIDAGGTYKSAAPSQTNERERELGLQRCPRHR